MAKETKDNEKEKDKAVELAMKQIKNISFLISFLYFFKID